jgi:endonuclease/exonuclease/phosphatase family metal-dependent hydrolase
MGSVSISSYNVLHPYLNHNNFAFLKNFNYGKDWASRVGQISQNILSSNSDIVCLQEISSDNFKELQRRLQGNYTGFHTKHDGGNGLAKPDGVAILYKNSNRFTFKGVKTCDKNSLSTTPRRHLYVDLEDNTTHRIIRCASGHIEGGPNRQSGNTQLNEMLKYIDTSYQGSTYQVDAVAVGIDLNEAPNGERFRIFSNFGYATDTDRGESEIEAGRKIDYIFSKACRPNLSLTREGMVNSNLPKASDHHMVNSKLAYSETRERREPSVGLPKTTDSHRLNPKPASGGSPLSLCGRIKAFSISSASWLSSSICSLGNAIRCLAIKLFCF